MLLDDLHSGKTRKRCFFALLSVVSIYNHVDINDLDPTFGQSSEQSASCRFVLGENEIHT